MQMDNLRRNVGCPLLDHPAFYPSRSDEVSSYSDSKSNLMQKYNIIEIEKGTAKICLDWLKLGRNE